MKARVGEVATWDRTRSTTLGAAFADGGHRDTGRPKVDQRVPVDIHQAAAAARLEETGRATMTPP